MRGTVLCNNSLCPIMRVSFVFTDGNAIKNSWSTVPIWFYCGHFQLHEQFWWLDRLVRNCKSRRLSFAVLISKLRCNNCKRSKWRHFFHIPWSHRPFEIVFIMEPKMWLNVHTSCNVVKFLWSKVPMWLCCEHFQLQKVIWPMDYLVSNCKSRR